LNHGLDQDQNLLVEVFDIYGKRIHMEQIISVGDEINRIIVFDQKLSSGMYLINLSVDDVYLTKKLIVE